MRKFTFLLVASFLVITNTQAQKALQASITSSTNISCYEDSSGSATVTARYGLLPYTYLWLPDSATTATDNHLVAGTYTVIVTDSVADSVFVSVTLTQPTQLNLSLTSLKNVKCSYDDTGSASVSASGGIPPYSYLWMPGGNTNSSDTGMSVGSYTVSVTDSNGCTATLSLYINSLSNIAASTGVTNASCFGMFNGSGATSATGGVAPYQFAWSPGGATTAVVSGLGAGIYTVTVTDVLGCQTQSTGTVGQPLPLLINATTYANYAQILASYGTPPYTYTWIPNVSTSSLATGLSRGTYTVTVNDANLCSDTLSVYVTGSIINYSFGYQTGCDYPDYFYFEIAATGAPLLLFNNCVVDISYTGGEFAGDLVSDSAKSGDIIVTSSIPNKGVGNDYNIINAYNLSDTVIEIQLGDTSIASTNGIGFDTNAFGILDVRLKIKNSCKPGIINFTNLLRTGSSSYYAVTANILDSLASTVRDSICCPYNCNPYLCNPHNCNPILLWNNITSSYDTSWTICYDTCQQICFDTIPVISYDSVFSSYSHDFPYSTTTYALEGIRGPNCLPNITDNTPYINAGTNAKSIPPNSSIFTINGTGFGSQKGKIRVTNADGPGSIPLDSTDILSWSENQIIVKMPSILFDTSLNVTPGTGPYTIYNTCGDAASDSVQINYNIENDYHSLTNEKARPNITMVDSTESIVWRCDTSITNNPQALACVRYAIYTWNCYTGVNWRLGPPIALDTTLPDGISNIYFSNNGSNFPTATALMATKQQISLCYDDIDSVVFYDEADIKIKRNRYLTKSWNYDTTGTITSSAFNYFYDAILHELGHGHGLGHINDPFSLMNWEQIPGRRFNIISGSKYPAPATLIGALDMIYTGVFPSNNPISLPPNCAFIQLDTSKRYCIDPTLSIPVIPKNSYSLNLFPNPASTGNITIAYTLKENSYIQFKIVDCIGREVIKITDEHKPTGDYSEQINITNLAKGVYLFTSNINGEYRTVKFIKL